MLLTTFILLGFGYAYWRLKLDAIWSMVLAIPFIFVWIIPMLYWRGKEKKDSFTHHLILNLGYLSMAWLNFLLFSLIFFDALYIISQLVGFAAIPNFIFLHRTPLVLWSTVLALTIGYFRAKKGPGLRVVEIAFEDLPRDFEGYKIIQISDLHVGPTLRKNYVEKVVEMTKAQRPDLITLTGDIVDGSVEHLREHTQPLQDLAAEGKAYLVLGNHDYYAGVEPWITEFKRLGLKVLLNEHHIVQKGEASLLIAGVTDPAAEIYQRERTPDPALALRNGSQLPSKGKAFRLLLAHHPKIAYLARDLGYDLQLSGHTHAGQFLPWTLVVKLIHKPHYWGLSQEGKMKVYVSAGTGTWGPPIRFGTEPEITLIKLVRRSH